MKELLIALGTIVPTIGTSAIAGVSIFFVSTNIKDFYHWFKSTTFFINIMEVSTIIVLGYVIIIDLTKQKFNISTLSDAVIAAIGMATILFFIEYLRKYTYRKFSIEWFKEI